MRYHLSCETCHTVIPELNAFGTSFRRHGYRLPLPVHGTTGIAIRYQLEWEKDPPAGTNRFTQGGVLLASPFIGAVTAFLHYNLGSGGGPSALYLGYLAAYNAHTSALYRIGLFELPLAQSPGQRLDDLQGYGYYGTRVGLNGLTLSQPRWGGQYERTFGSTTADFTIAFGAYNGSAYGGKPLNTGDTAWANAPELGFWARTAVAPNVEIGAQYLTGVQHITLTGKPGFDDSYHREGLLARATYKKLDFQGEQWWGNDLNSDGFGSQTGSSGGYARLKYYVTPHSYLGVRYDASANPFLARDMTYYFAFMVTPHVRLVVQQVQLIPGQGHLGAAITVGAPWPAKL